jgi:hypothetical protein
MAYLEQNHVLVLQFICFSKRIFFSSQCEPFDEDQFVDRDVDNVKLPRASQIQLLSEKKKLASDIAVPKDNGRFRQNHTH